MALVTAAEAARIIPGVSRHLIGMWRHTGKLQQRGTRGRSPLYAWDDIVNVEHATRTSGRSHRAAA